MLERRDEQLSRLRRGAIWATIKRGSGIERFGRCGVHKAPPTLQRDGRLQSCRGIASLCPAILVDECPQEEHATDDGRHGGFGA